MKGLDIKATIYDIFGYLLPGLLVIIIIIFSFQHSYGLFEISDMIDLVKSLGGIEFTFVFFLAYILGHCLSSLSSIILEKNFIFKLKYLSDLINVNHLLSETLRIRLMDKYREVTNSELTDKDFRFLITYVESKQPAIYSTAFVYLSFYGMARTIALVFSIGFIWEIINILILGYKGSIIFSILYLTLFFLFIYHYFRFLRYFREQIVMGFILPS